MPPPPALDCARVIEYAVLDKSVGYAGRTLLFVDGKELGQVPCLAICKDTSTTGFLLLHCDLEWNSLGCSGHGSIEDAKARAEKIYPGVSARWINPNVAEEQAEQYLDDLFGEHRCSFCGRRGDKVNRLIQKDQARICGTCISEFHKAIENGEPQ